ncbi:MAG TPA: VWA domain-containing protein [Mucilaginibacter sp.]|nr:VWA domain-containing protein [Mucilaginibacter sp.]
MGNQDEFTLVLFALILLPVLFFLKTIHWKKYVTRNLGNKPLITDLTGSYSPSRYLMKFLITMTSIILVALVIAVSKKNPARMNSGFDNADIIIVLDLSESMSATDVYPSRLEESKRFIDTLLDETTNCRYGLVVFAGNAFVGMPLTLDRDAIRVALKYADPKDMPAPGTKIGSALKTALKALNTHSLRPKEIVLISDGEDFDNRTHSVLESFKDKRISINTIGAGTVQGTRLADTGKGEFRKDAAGRDVISKLNTSLLNSIAETTGGKFIRLVPGKELNTAKALSEPGRAGDQADANFNKPLIISLFIAAILLVIEIFIPENKRTLFKKSYILYIPFFLLTFETNAQSLVSVQEKGDDFYSKGNYNEAILTYQRILEREPKNMIVLFNFGNAQFKLRHYRQSTLAFEQVSLSSDKKLSQRSYYNLGVSLTRMNKLNEAAAAFQKAILLNTKDEESRENLQFLLNKLRQQSSSAHNSENTDTNQVMKREATQKSLSNQTQSDALLNQAQRNEEKVIMAHYTATKKSLPADGRDW